MLISFLFLLSPLLVHSIFSWGSCPSVSLQADFDITKYTGVWYEIIRDKDIPFEKGVCIQAEYTLNADNTLTVVNSEVIDGSPHSVTGKAHCESDDPAYCHVRFSEYGPEGDYRVVKTDYENFSIVYSCTSWGVSSVKWVWLLARNRDFDFSTMIEDLEKLGFSQKDLHFTEQTDCEN